MPCVSESTAWWSIITSSATNSQLAGVLAGFMVTVIAVLAIRDHRLDTHTIALFSAGALTLGLDSYLFSAITGASPPGDNVLDRYLFSTITGAPPPADEACKVVWAQGMAASGMLAIGGSVFVCGLGWILVNHVNQHGVLAPDAGERRTHLITLAGFLTAAVITTTTSLLATTTIDYLRLVRWDHTQPIYIFGLIVVAVASTAIYRRTRAMRAAVSRAPSKEIPTSLGALPAVTYTITAFAIGATVFCSLLSVGVLADGPVVRSLAVIAGFVGPGVISGLLAFSVAEPSPGSLKLKPLAKAIAFLVVLGLVIRRLSNSRQPLP